MKNRPANPIQTGAPEGAQAYWDTILDPQNITTEAAAESPEALARAIAFALSPDVLEALRWLRGGPGEAQNSAGAPVDQRLLIDLGAGLGNHTFAFCRRGWRVVAVDSSPRRMRALAGRARASGIHVACVVAAAEALPFRDASVPALFTKSVLIHTDLARAAAEIERVAAAGGRAALVEPQPGNPFAAMYRRLCAPEAWQGITRYFGSVEQAIFLRAFNHHGRVAPYYGLGFLAFYFEFARPWPAARQWMLGVLGVMDAPFFFLVPPARRAAWFGVIELEKPLMRPDDKSPNI